MRTLVFVASLLLLPAGLLAQMPPANVVVAPVEQRDLQLTRPLVASVEAVTSTTLAAEEPGLVKERAFDEGQMVERGHVLVRQDVDLLQVQLQAAEAALKSAEAMVQLAEAELRNAENELQRLSTLFQREAVTEKEYRDAQTTLEVRQAALAARKADVLARQADLERTKLQLAKSEVRCPINGVVQRRHVEVGQWLQQGDPVADLVQLDPLFVRVNVPEIVVPQLKVGDEAKVTFDALGGVTVSARIEQILPQADPATRTFPVKLALENPDLTYRPGFFARVTLVARAVPGAVVVPKNAVVTQGRDSRVVVARGNVAEIVPVKLGHSDGSYIAVTPLQGELKVGDQVVIRGNEQLMPGHPLIIAGAPGGGASQQGGEPHTGSAAPEAAPADQGGGQ